MMTEVSMTPERAACFQAGADARAAGLDETDNPYDPASPQGHEWHAGWSATFDLDEEDDPSSTRMQKQDSVDPDP